MQENTMFRTLSRVMLVGLMATGILVTSACVPLEPQREYVQRDDLQVDPEIRQALTVSELLQSRVDLPGGGSLLKIQFSVKGYQDVGMEWKATWFDADGMVVPGVGEGYNTARVMQNQTRFFTASAPNERAVSFQLHLREDR